jgi:hypothetical protein
MRDVDGRVIETQGFRLGVGAILELRGGDVDRREAANLQV